MVDDKVLGIAQRRLEIEIAKQRARLQEEVARVTGEFNSRGMLHSGNFVGHVAKVCSSAAEERSHLAWEILYRTITTAGVKYADGLEAQLKAAIDHAVVFDDLNALPSEKANMIGMANASMLRELNAIVETGRASGVDRTRNEIGLFVASLQRQEKAEDRAASTVNVYAYAPVASIQTGANATATVHQWIDAESRGKLDEALARLEAALAQVEALPDASKDEIVEIVQEARNEVARPQPNASKLKALLSTVGNSVRTVGALKGAYEVLKVIAESVGIPMP